MLPVILVAAALSAASCLPHNCNKGPDYWCQSVETATACNVLEFCQANSEFNLKGKDAQPVLIELYYESLCPGCREFINEQLWPTWQKLQSTGAMDIDLYPYGNAHEEQVGQKWLFTCQHGVDECNLNMVEACAIHHMAHPITFMPYVHCIEAGEPSLSVAQQCAKDLGIAWGPISNCYNGTEGNHLMHELAVQTESLQPPHQFVPWIVVNGQHTDDIQQRAQENLLQFVCDTYTGQKPQACLTKANRCMKVL